MVLLMDVLLIDDAMMMMMMMLLGHDADCKSILLVLSNINIEHIYTCLSMRMCVCLCVRMCMRVCELVLSPYLFLLIPICINIYV